MTDEERRMLREIHDYWFKVPRSGGNPRAQQFDEMATLIRTAKFGGRVMLWVTAAVAAVAAAVKQLRGL